MCYTAEQKNLIGAMISANFMGRNLSPSLRSGFIQAYKDLESDDLSSDDLRLIKSALELITPQSCQSCSKEGYRDMVGVLAATRCMLAESISKKYFF